MPDQLIFISHANEDSEVADRIVAYLEQNGLPCWISSRDIPPRAIYAEAITSGMQASMACVVIVSEAANASAAIKRELELASHSGKPFIPIRIDGVEPGPGLDYYLRNTQWIEYHSERERGLDRIIKSLKSPPAAARAAPSAPPRAPSRGNALPLILGAGALALALGAGAYFYWQSQNQVADTPITSDEVAPPQTVNTDGVWDINVLCASGSKLQEPSVTFTDGAYTRIFNSDAASGETQLFIESSDARTIRVHGRVAFSGGDTYPVDATGTTDENGIAFTGSGQYGLNADCPFTAVRSAP